MGGVVIGCVTTVLSPSVWDAGRCSTSSIVATSTALAAAVGTAASISELAALMSLHVATVYCGCVRLCERVVSSSGLLDNSESYRIFFLLGVVARLGRLPPGAA